MNDAGKVAFTPKGDYSSTVTYEYLDTVVYNGNAYVALKTTTGNAPTDSDTDENWKLLARGGVTVPLATETTPGVVRAGSDVDVIGDGSMVLKTDFTAQESLAELTSGEDRTTFFGKIAKSVSSLITHVSLIASPSVRGHVKLSNSSAINVPGEYALDAREKNASVSGTLANQISSLNTKIGSLFMVRTVQSSDVVIQPNETVSFTASAMLNGYKPIALAGFDCDGSGESNIRVYTVRLIDNTLHAAARNSHASVVCTCHMIWHVLYYKI